MGVSAPIFTVLDIYNKVIKGIYDKSINKSFRQQSD
jgi:hypothetical protein